LVGYTNAGKSTLLNTLASAGVFVEDKLFATLDPTTRRLPLPDKKQVLLTDTVGFIQKLPLTVVAAFRATLEELAEADLLLHIVDITHRDASQQCQTVEDILLDLKLYDKPRLTVLNKVDLLLGWDHGLEGETTIAQLAGQLNINDQRAVLISAAKGWGLGNLLELISQTLPQTISSV